MPNEGGARAVVSRFKVTRGDRSHAMVSDPLLSVSSRALLFSAALRAAHVGAQPKMLDARLFVCFDLFFFFLVSFSWVRSRPREHRSTVRRRAARVAGKSGLFFVYSLGAREERRSN